MHSEYMTAWCVRASRVRGIKRPPRRDVVNDVTRRDQVNDRCYTLLLCYTALSLCLSVCLCVCLSLCGPSQLLRMWCDAIRPGWPRVYVVFRHHFAPSRCMIKPDFFISCSSRRRRSRGGVAVWAPYCVRRRRRRCLVRRHQHRAS